MISFYVYDDKILLSFLNYFNQNLHLSLSIVLEKKKKYLSIVFVHYIFELICIFLF